MAVIPATEKAERPGRLQFEGSPHKKLETPTQSASHGGGGSYLSSQLYKKLEEDGYPRPAWGEKIDYPP
jgi:hypothetical protein